VIAGAGGARGTGRRSGITDLLILYIGNPPTKEAWS
jgi:hypothetical protein